MTRSQSSPPPPPPPAPHFQTPDAVVRAAFAALEEKRWIDVAALLDTRDLVQFREQRVALARAAEQQGALSATELRQLQPGMPKEVAEWMSREQQREADGHLAREFAGVKSAAELERLGAQELFARWLEAQDPEWQVRQRLDAARKDGDSQTPPRVRVTRHIVNHVMDGEDLAHVVFRTRWSTDTTASGANDVGVITVRRTVDGEWRLRVDPSFFVRPASLAIHLNDRDPSAGH